MMSVAFSVTKHAMGYPSNVLAQRSGEHVFSIKLSTDTDNGNLVAAGDWDGLDVFKEAAVTTFGGKIIQKMSNGNWLVLVTNPGDALLVYEKPLSPYESPKDLLSEKAFYNKAGDRVRAYGLHKFDRFEVSDEAFSGADPAVGKVISAVTDKKMVVPA